MKLTFIFPSPACTRTQVYLSSGRIMWPKSDKSDFGWRVGWGPASQ